MTPRSRPANPLEELQFALAEGVAEEPSATFADDVVTAALTARPPGRHVDNPSPITPAEAFRRAARSLDQVLSSLDAEEWRRPAIRDLDVQGLVGHVIAVERDFQRALVTPDGPQAGADHVASTDAVAAAQAGRAPSETQREWRAALADTFAALDELDGAPGRATDVVSLHGVRLAISPLLVVRTFELWTHEEDIRRATGRPLRAPDAATLAVMTALGVNLVPAGLARVSDSGAGRTARIVLTGAGGGTWQTGLGRQPHAADAGPLTDGPVDVRIVVDAVGFCRLLANRIDPTALTAVVSGDTALARDLFVGAARLALD